LTWDALDQLTDQPEPNETIYAYQIVGRPTAMFICGRGTKAASGMYACAEYRLVTPQPHDADMRTTDRWHAWTRAHAPSFTTEPKP
jgi:hypothetical protein